MLSFAETNPFLTYMKSDLKKDIYMISIIMLIMAIGLFLFGLASHRANLIALPCGVLAATSIIWMIVFNPGNRLDSLKPSTKKSIYRISFFCMIAFFIGLIAAIRYSYMTDTDIATRILSTLFFISAVILGFFRRYKSQWTENNQDQTDSESK